jgi:hypothetical protein
MMYGWMCRRRRALGAPPPPPPPGARPPPELARPLIYGRSANRDTNRREPKEHGMLQWLAPYRRVQNHQKESR